MKKNKKTKELIFDQANYEKHKQLYPFNHQPSFAKWLHYNNTTPAEFLQQFYTKEVIGETKENLTQTGITKQPRKIDLQWPQPFIRTVVQDTSKQISKRLSRLPEDSKSRLKIIQFIKLFEQDLTDHLQQYMTEVYQTPKSNLITTVADQLLSQKNLTEHAKSLLSAYQTFAMRLYQDSQDLTLAFGIQNTFDLFIKTKQPFQPFSGIEHVCKFDKQKVIYIPKTMDHQHHFQAMLKDLNAAALTSFKSPPLLNKNTHGWILIQDNHENTNRKNNEHLLQLFGNHLALMQLLNIDKNITFQDAHTNVEMPFLDNGSIFDMNTHTRPSNQCESDEKPEYQVTLYKHMFNFFKHAQRQPRTSVQFSLYQQLTKDQLAANHVMQGYRQLYLFFKTHRTWLSKNRHFKALTSLKYRCKMRSDGFYAQIIRRVNNDKDYTTELDRGLFTHHQLWKQSKQNCLQRLAGLEVDYINQAWIPSFYYSPRSKRLITAVDQGLNQFFNNTALEKINANLNNLSEEDLKKNLQDLQAIVNQQKKSN